MTSTEQTNKIQEFSEELLTIYYARLFPYTALYEWLSYGNDPNSDSLAVQRDFFSRREFSFTIADDIYIRYQSFRTNEEMTEGIMRRTPHKIDIGAVFSAPPKDHNTIDPSVFKPVERELVFDIDMTDYDDIRTCCTGANICLRCWPYMTMAVKVIHQTLREDFGFEHILWVYSGRRGVHCWVCDDKARCLSNEARSAIVEYLSFNHGDIVEKKGKLSLHPMLDRAYETLEPYFERCIADGAEGQGLLETKDRYIKVLNSIPNETMRIDIYNEWEKRTMSGLERWRYLKEATTQNLSSAAKRAKANFNELKAWKYSLVFKHCYPRLDANVSKAQNHLLKSPFCVHPKTGRVCVTIDPAQADTFNPFAVPTVRMLCDQIDKFEDDGDDSIKDIDKTSMKDCMKTFHKSFMNSMAKENRRVIKDKLERINATAVDF